MKKNRHGHTDKATKKSKATPAKDTGAIAENSETVLKDLLDDEDAGFGGWLKSGEGLETMKLFVVANTVVLLTTLAYPHVQLVFDILYDSLYGPDPLY